MATSPRLEGSIPLPDGRRIGFAEYGSPEGRPVLWFHGTPGARRQIPEAARLAAVEREVRLIALERPGVGASSPHLFGCVLDWTDDVDVCAERLGVDRFGVVGLSGGGPYALACAFRWPDRVTTAAVLGGVAPTRGDDAIDGGLVDLAARTAPLLGALRVPISHGLWATVRIVQPLASPLFDLYVRLSPEGDRQVFRSPGMKAMFIDDLLGGSRRWFGAPMCDLVLFGRHWGFNLVEVKVPVHFWHGDADPIVPLRHGRHLAATVPDAEIRVRRGESHLGGLGAAHEILEVVVSHP